MAGTQGSVFISHSSADRAAAEALAAQLESEGASVWIAPRDVLPGRDYSGQLDEAIAGCAALVLLVSASTAGSSAVRGEAEQAARDGKPIFPLRIADVDVGGDLPLLGAVKYWTDGFGPNAGRNVGRLAEELRALGGPAAAAPVAPPAPPPPPPAPPLAQSFAAPAGAPPAPSSAPPAPSGAPPAPAGAPPAPAYAPAPAAYAPPPQAYAQPAPQPLAGGDQEEMLRAFVGPNADLYLSRWQAMAATGSPRSWNWAAFLLSMFWLAYRKMWQPLGIFLGAFLAIQVIAIFVPALGMLANGASIGLAAWTGWMGTGLYKTHAERAVATAQGLYPEPQSRLAALRIQGGVSMPAALGVAAGWFVLMAIATFFIMDQVRRAGQLRPGTASSTVGGTYGDPNGSPTNPNTGGAPAVSDMALIGTWGETNCSGNRIQFMPGNRFSADQSGTYSVSGSTLTLSYGTQSDVMQIQMLSNDAFTLSAGGRQMTMVRC